MYNKQADEYRQMDDKLGEWASKSNAYLRA